MIYLLGILAGALMAYAALPAAIRTIKASKHLGTPVDISAVVLAGTVVSWLYLFFSYGFNLLLTINYGIGAVCWGVLLLYGVFKKHVTNKQSR